MADAELGQKRACPSCGGKFYDLTKNPADCPYCEAVFNPDDLIRGRGRKGAVQEEPKPKPVEKPVEEKSTDEDAEVPDDIADVDVDDDGDEDDDVLEDASDLGEDDSDLGEVMEHVEKPEKES